MDANDMLKAVQPLTDARNVLHRDGFVLIALSAEEYEAFQGMTAMISAASVLNHQRALASFPALVSAAQRVLEVANNPEEHLRDDVRLSTRTRNQVEGALRQAGFEVD